MEELDKIRSIPIEQAVLGSMTNDIKAILAVKNSATTQNDFYMDKHKVIYNAINEMYKAQIQVDIVTLGEHLQSKNQLEQVGGMLYLAEISDSVITTSNVQSYISRLLDYSCKRQIYDIAKYIKNNVSMESEQLKSQVHKKILDVFDREKNKTSIEEQGEKFLEILERRAKGERIFIKTGLWKLDEIIGGFNRSELITLFAFSGVGKTTLGIQIALNAIRQNRKVLFFSLEMTEPQLIERMNANLCGISSNDLRNGNLKDKDWENVSKRTAYLCSNNRLKISRANTIEEIVAEIQLEKLKNDIDLVFIDYVGLIEAPTAERRDLQVANITRKLKLLAINTDIPICILAQSKQAAAEKSANNNLKIHEKLSDTDIGESASIFRDSDKVIGMYRNTDLDDETARTAAEKVDYNSRLAIYNPNCVNLLVRKCRTGTKATLAFMWEGQYYRIRNYER
jgi:replicative DNA helicase